MTQVGLRRDAKILVDERPTPGVVVRYVGVELLARLGENEEGGGLEEGRDVGERLGWEVEQNVAGSACSIVAVRVVSMLACVGVARAGVFVSAVFSGVRF